MTSLAGLAVKAQPVRPGNPGSKSGGRGLPTDATFIPTAAQTNIPFELAVPIAPNTLKAEEKIAVADGATPIPVQEDNRGTDRNGWVRWVKLSGYYPGSPTPNWARTLTLSVVSGSPAPGTAISVSDILNATTNNGYDCIITLTDDAGTVWTAAARDGLGARVGWQGVNSPSYHATFRSGPYCTEHIVSVPFRNGGTAHAQLRAYFSIAAYKIGAGAVDARTNPVVAIATEFNIEAAYIRVAKPSDYYYDARVQLGHTAQTTVLNYTGTTSATNITLKHYLDNEGRRYFTAVRTSGTWSVNDVGGTLIELSGGATGRGYIASLKSYPTSDSALVCEEPNQKFSDATLLTRWRNTGICHHFRTAWRPPYNSTTKDNRLWWGTQPKYACHVSGAHIIASQMVPNYQARPSGVSVNLSAVRTFGTKPYHTNGLAWSGNPPAPNGHKPDYMNQWLLNTPGTGGSDDIAVIPGYYVTDILRWDAEQGNALEHLIEHMRCQDSVPTRLRNELDGTLLGPDDCGVYGDDGFRKSGVPFAKINFTGTATTSPWLELTNHAIQRCYVPYLLLGRYFDLENNVVRYTFDVWDGGYQDNQAKYRGGIPSGAPAHGFGRTIGVFDRTIANQGMYRCAPVGVTSGSGVTNVTTMTIVGASSYPHQTGELFFLGNYLSRTGTPTFSADLNTAWYLRRLTATTFEMYDTRARALDTNATAGRITVLTWPGDTYAMPINGYANVALWDQVRTGAWWARNLCNLAAILPDSIHANLSGWTRAAAHRTLDNMNGWFANNYVNNTDFQTPGPRWIIDGLLLDQNSHPQVHASALWEVAFWRLGLMMGQEAGVLGPVGESCIDWLLEDALLWPLRTSDTVPQYLFATYYLSVSSDVFSGGFHYGYTFNDLYKIMMANGLNNGFSPSPDYQYMLNFSFPTRWTASVSSVANPAAVTITLSAPFFDNTKGSASLARHVNSLIMVGNGNSLGTIAAVPSETTCVADFTVYRTGAPPTGGGQKVCLPPMSWGNGNALIDGLLNWGNKTALGPGGGSPPSTTYYTHFRVAAEFAKQRGVNASNYNDCIAFFRKNNVPDPVNLSYLESIASRV